jgi:hypothetical protein
VSRWSFLLLAGLVSCAHTRNTVLRIEPTADSNAGRPVYLLVRTTTPQGYLEQGYPAIASLVGRPDDSVHSSVVVFPGHATEIALPPSSSDALAVYVLFTQPRGSWRTLLPLPSSGRVRVRVAADHLELVEPRSR